MSVGNVTQAIDLERDSLSLVLGNNLDLGGDGSRNGTGRLLLSMHYHMLCTVTHSQISKRIT